MKLKSTKTTEFITDDAIVHDNIDSIYFFMMRNDKGAD
jgi:hypothetical protein